MKNFQILVNIDWEGSTTGKSAISNLSKTITPIK